MKVRISFCSLDYPGMNSVVQHGYGPQYNVKCHKLTPKTVIVTNNMNFKSWECLPSFCLPSSFLSGPASLRETKSVIYPCFSGRCQVGCPCIQCLESVEEKTFTIQEYYQNHHMYHHAAHLTCEFCCQILDTFPSFSCFKKNIGYKFVLSWLFSHSYGDIDSKRKMPRRAWNLDNKPAVNHNELKTCDECNESFKTSFNKDRHYMNVHYKQKYQCAECLQWFGRKDNLKKHILNVHEAHESLDEDYITENVMEEIDEEDLEIRNDSGSNSFQWKCHDCDKNFSSKFNLGVHKKKVKKCEKCDKSFCNNKMLKVHMKFSHGIHPFECETCHEKFSTKQTLNRHEQAKKVASCDECGAKFCNSRSMDSHQSKHWWGKFMENKEDKS